MSGYSPPLLNSYQLYVSRANMTVNNTFINLNFKHLTGNTAINPLGRLNLKFIEFICDASAEGHHKLDHNYEYNPLLDHRMNVVKYVRTTDKEVLKHVLIHYVSELEYVTMRDLMHLVEPLYDIRGDSFIVLCADGITYQEMNGKLMRGDKWIFSTINTCLAEVLVELVNDLILDFKPTIRDVIYYIDIRS